MINIVVYTRIFTLKPLKRLNDVYSFMKAARRTIYTIHYSYLNVHFRRVGLIILIFASVVVVTERDIFRGKIRRLNGL